MTEPLVSKLDHVSVPVRDPAPLFELFTETLGLPVAWPIHDYGPFRSGGVALGNANLEFVAADPARMPSMAPTEPLTVRGIAFEATSDKGWIAALDERELAHTELLPHEGVGVHGNSELLWTNVILGGMVGREAITFLCHYYSEEALKGSAAREALERCGGGVLGIKGMTEVTIGVADIDKADARWQRFLAPAQPDAHGAFHVGDGPAIRLKQSPMDGVAGLWLEVESLAKARRALRDLDMLGPMRASGIGLDYARTDGLDVWLTEGR